jgi:excisionase family DNA binding protein
MSQYLTADEVAEELRVHSKSVRQWCRLGQLKAKKAGKQWRITRADLNAFLEHTAGTEPEPEPKQS